MNYVLKIKEWGNMHHRPWMDPLRIAFGIALLLKGLYYIYYSDYAIRWLQSGFFLKEASGVFSLLLAFLHIFLGLCILLGIITRFSSVVLIPVLLFGIAYTNVTAFNPLSILFSVIALGLCTFFFIEGSGKFSLYAYMSNPKTSPENMTTGEDNVKTN
jgi:putative oxidoreductase